MLILVAAVVIVLGVVLRRGIWPARWVIGGWHSVKAYVVTAPASFLYVLIIGVTTFVLVSSADALSELLLTSRSSTLQVLLARPFRGFVQSALWVATPIEFPVAILYATLLAPVERWLGSLRWIIIVVLGHVLATLLVAILIWGMVRGGWVGDGATRGIDVGVSYAFGAVAGTFTYLLRGRLRAAYVAVLLGVLVLILIAEPSFTAVGHIAAVLIGLALGAYLKEQAPAVDPAAPIYPRPLWRP